MITGLGVFIQTEKNEQNKTYYKNINVHQTLSKVSIARISIFWYFAVRSFMENSKEFTDL